MGLALHSPIFPVWGSIPLTSRALGTHRPGQPVPHSSESLSGGTSTISLTVLCPPFPGPRARLPRRPPRSGSSGVLAPHSPFSCSLKPKAIRVSGGLAPHHLPLMEAHVPGLRPHLRASGTHSWASGLRKPVQAQSGVSMPGSCMAPGACSWLSRHLGVLCPFLGGLKPPCFLERLRGMTRTMQGSGSWPSVTACGRHPGPHGSRNWRLAL